MSTNVTAEQVISIIEELKEASKLYYLDGEDSPLTDEEFDSKQNFLNTIKNDFQELFKEGTDGHKILDEDVLLGAVISNTDNTIIHQSPMLSLAKAKKESELDAYLVKTRKAGATDFRLQAKLDGVAISARYENGALTLVSTRGNGVIGENVTYIANTKNLKILGLPLTIDDQDNVEVRGELFFTNEQFIEAKTSRKNYDGTQFELSRNAVAGIVKKSKAGLPYEVTMTFGSYSAWKNNNPAPLNEITNESTFLSVDTLTEKEAKNVKLSGFENDEQIHKAIVDFGKIRESFSIPTDGVVIKPTNETEMIKIMGNTSHHPASQIAWKYPAEQAQTTVLKIVTTVGKTGRLTPVAEFEPVKLDGSTIERASLHNFALLEEKDVREGSIIIIEKANEIIPQVVSVISSPKDSKKITAPETCPSCGEKTVSEDGVFPPRTLLCVNNECPSRSFESLVFAVGRDYLNIDRLSSATLNYLNQAGIVSDIADLYELDEITLSEVVTGTTQDGDRKLGEKNAKHIMSYIEKSKTLPLERILASFSIPTVGRRAAKEIVNAFGTIDNILNATVEDFTKLDKFAEVKAQKTYEGLQMRKAIIERMKAAGVLFGNVSTSVDKDDTVSLSGTSFSISGTVPEPFENRNSMVEYIENHGGEFHSSPKNSTSFMIGERGGSSSKVKKAETLGIEFITPEEFTNRFVKNAS